MGSSEEDSPVDENQSTSPTTSSATTPPSKSSPAWHNVIAGGMAGAGSRVLTAPLDLIRIRRQLSTAKTSYPRESMLDSWHKIVQTEGGITALFRGNMAAVYLWVGYAAVQFSLYNRTREAIEAQYGSNYPTQTAFVSGAVAGTCATLATYPFDVCRTTFAARGIETVATAVATTPPPPPPPPPSPPKHHMPFSSLVELQYFDRHHSASPSTTSATTTPSTMAASATTAEAAAVAKAAPPRTFSEFSIQLYQQAGIRGFYAGAGPAVVQIIPYMGLNFAIYDRLTRDHKGVGLSAYAGAISGFISKLVVYPLDTTKRRLQIQAFYGSEQEALFQKYKGMMDCATQIARKEGVSGFYKGAVPSVLKTTISTCLSFSFFRFSKNMLEVIEDTWKG